MLLEPRLHALPAVFRRFLAITRAIVGVERVRRAVVDDDLGSRIAGRFKRRTHLLDVRHGKISEQECLTRAGELERELTDLETTSPLPPSPDEARVEEWAMGAYRRTWQL